MGCRWKKKVRQSPLLSLHPTPYTLQPSLCPMPVEPAIRKVLPPLSLAPSSLLARNLLEGISKHYLWQSECPIVTAETIPLYKSKDRSKDGRKKILYISGIALKLEKLWRQSPLEIATSLAPLIPVSPDFTLTVVPPGWIHLQFTDTGIANFLQYLAQNAYGQWGEASGAKFLPQNIGDPTNASSKSDAKNSKLHSQNSAVKTKQSLSKGVFQIQYANARCCSLLRSACQEGLIVPYQLARDISWLDERDQLRLTEPRELVLISRLMATLDALARRPERDKILKLAAALAEDFEKFYSACRILGKVKQENLDLARGRLGLVLGTQKLLRFLLEEGLALAAPEEL
ncbi:MAG: hypothetical protein F6J93_19740 [Oscillatoria sp. SIO1A7]|nr:hypothetical protein [Oscillatoria sp. SIO1A7]